MVANKRHAYIEKWVYSKYIVHNSVISGVRLPQFKFGSIYIFILKLMNFILLIYPCIKDIIMFADLKTYGYRTYFWLIL